MFKSKPLAVAVTLAFAAPLSLVAANAGAAVLELTAGITCILDGASGSLYTEPSASDLESARLFQTDMLRQREEEHYARYQPALTTDGHRVEVVANIGKAAEAAGFHAVRPVVEVRGTCADCD